MKQEYDVITVLDTCVDLMMQGGDIVPRFGQAEQLVSGYQLEMGGSACIFASQCAKLGLQTVGTGKVGKDAFGALVLERLREAGVDITHVEVDEGVQTGLGLALCTQDNDRAILTVAGSIDSADPKTLLRMLPRARHLHVASYYLLSGMRPHWPEILLEARRLGLTCSLDTNWDPAERWGGLDELTPYLDILMPNEHEITAFTGIHDPEKAAREVAKRIPIVVVKLGAEGAMLVQEDRETLHCPANEVDVVDTVGAGDTFDAGFLYGYLNGLRLEDCLRVGVFCASRSVRKQGGFIGQPDAAELATQPGFRPF
jgi:sugar/nucleoside kinase (ribokinase family)